VSGTAHANRVELMELVRCTFRDGTRALGVEFVSIASALHLNSSAIVERWAKSRIVHGVEEPIAPLPVWLLCDPMAIPNALYHRIIAVVEARRMLRGAGITTTPEGAGFAVVVHASEAIAELGRALADGQISVAEVPAARLALTRLAAKIEMLLRLLSAVEHRVTQ
jgi:hypothetical protein